MPVLDMCSIQMSNTSNMCKCCDMCITYVSLIALLHELAKHDCKFALHTSTVLSTARSTGT
jgi:hypothetical protein